MPKYEYACKSCGERIEVKQSFKDDPLTECPTCGGVLRKVFSSPGIVLRGPGFYRTDHRSPYRPDGTRPAEKEKDREHAEAKAGAESKGGDTKAEPKGADAKSESKGDSKGADSKAGDKGSSEKGSSEKKGSGSSGGSHDAARTA
jgi:putative FmdB family regulatory protein